MQNEEQTMAFWMHFESIEISSSWNEMKWNGIFFKTHRHSEVIIQWALSSGFWYCFEGSNDKTIHVNLKHHLQQSVWYINTQCLLNYTHRYRWNEFSHFIHIWLFCSFHFVDIIVRLLWWHSFYRFNFIIIIRSTYIPSGNMCHEHQFIHAIHVEAHNGNVILYIAAPKWVYNYRSCITKFISLKLFI